MPGDGNREHIPGAPFDDLGAGQRIRLCESLDSWHRPPSYAPLDELELLRQLLELDEDEELRQEDELDELLLELLLEELELDED
jgi:hypothetical protein